MNRGTLSASVAAQPGIRYINQSHAQIARTILSGYEGLSLGCWFDPSPEPSDWESNEEFLNGNFQRCRFISSRKSDYYKHHLALESVIAYSAGTPLARPRIWPGEPFVSTAQYLASSGNIDSALDIIYKNIDQLFKEGAFSRVNAIFKTMPPVALSVDIILGLLTASLPARRRLADREEFAKEAERVLHDRGEWERNLFVGLVD